MAKQIKPKDRGEVEIRMVNPKRTGTITVRDYTDKETGKLREFKDAQGNVRIKKYTKGRTVLRMENEDDKLEFLHVKDHPIYVKGSYPSLKIVDLVQDAEDRVSLRELSVDALIEARKLRGEKLVDFARVLGINTNNVLESIVKDQMYSFLEEKPEQFLALLNDPDRLFREILYKGQMREIFTTKNGVWKYRDTLMGASIEEAILWLGNNQDLLTSIRKEIASVK